MTANIHMGQLKDGTRVVVAYKQIPNNPLQALVIKIDSLIKDVDRDELKIMIADNTAQLEKDFINYLHRKGLLDYYHKNNLFAAVDIDNVLMTPHGASGQTIELRTVINAINQQNGLGPLPTKEDFNNISKANPLAKELQEDLNQTEDKLGIAKSLIFQADMLIKEAERKRLEAYAMAPSLRPVLSPAQTPVVVSSSQEILAKLNANKPLTEQAEDNVLPDLGDIPKVRKKRTAKKRKTTKRKAAKPVASKVAPAAPASSGE